MCCTGRLSKEEIEKMVRDAERYKEEDDKQRERLQAKNALESYAFNMKQTIEDDKLKDKISEDDRKAVLDKCNEVIQWIDGNQVCWLLIIHSHEHKVAYDQILITNTQGSHASWKVLDFCKISRPEKSWKMILVLEIQVKGSGKS